MQSAIGGLYERTCVLLGNDGICSLNRSHVCVVGLGGVGAYAAEALCRAGVGSITIIDHDVVSVSNKNRQLLALDDTIGINKAAVLKKRLLSINKSCEIYTIDGFLLPQDCDRILRETLPFGLSFDYVIDAIDSLACKIALLEACTVLRIPVVTTGGAGGRLDPTTILITDLLDVNGDPMIARLRHEVKFPRDSITCVWSTEIPIPPQAPQRQESAEGRPRAVNGTISYMPAIFGLFQASVVIRNLSKRYGGT